MTSPKQFILRTIINTNLEEIINGLRVDDTLLSFLETKAIINDETKDWLLTLKGKRPKATELCKIFRDSITDDKLSIIIEGLELSCNLLVLKIFVDTVKATQAVPIVDNQNINQPAKLIPVLNMETNISKVLNEADDHQKMAQIIIEDSVALDHWVRISQVLGLGADFENFNRPQLFIGVIDGLFQRMVAEWAEKNGNAATVENLCKLLDDAKFRMTAGKIKSLFGG